MAFLGSGELELWIGDKLYRFGCFLGRVAYSLLIEDEDEAWALYPRQKRKLDQINKIRFARYTSGYTSPKPDIPDPTDPKCWILNHFSGTRL